MSLESRTLTGKLIEGLENTGFGTKWSHSPENEKSSSGDDSETADSKKLMAEPTRLELATSNVTGWRSNQLNYDSAINLWNFGGHRRTRTSNFLLVREAVYQLTYMPD